MKKKILSKQIRQNIFDEKYSTNNVRQKQYQIIFDSTIFDDKIFDKKYFTKYKIFEERILDNTNFDNQSKILQEKNSSKMNK